jgi:drug/metabolite transporter (DMT)-like permease
MRYRCFAAFVGLSLLWGSEWMLMTSIPEQPHLRALAIRYGLSALLLMPAAIRRRLWRRPVRSIAIAVIVGSGILCLPQILIYISSRYLSAPVVLGAMAAVPVLLAISGRLSITTAVAGLAGVLFLTSNGLSIVVPQIPWLSLPLAAAAVLAVALAAAEKQLRGISGPAISMLEVLFAQCAVSALLLWIASILLERQPVSWSATAALGFLIGAAVMTVCGYLLFYWLLGKSGAGAVSMLQWTQPLIVIVESAVWMHIRPDWTAAVGGILIVAASIWAFSNRDDQGVMFEITQT